jgi:hypothetical protein
MVAMANVAMRTTPMMDDTKECAEEEGAPSASTLMTSFI